MPVPNLQLAKGGEAGRAQPCSCMQPEKRKKRVRAGVEFPGLQEGHYYRKSLFVD